MTEEQRSLLLRGLLCLRRLLSLRGLLPFLAKELLAFFGSMLGSRTLWLGCLGGHALGQGWPLLELLLRLLLEGALALLSLPLLELLLDLLLLLRLTLTAGLFLQGALALLALPLLELLLDLLLLLHLALTAGLFLQGAPLGFTPLLECLGGCVLWLGLLHASWLRLHELLLTRLTVTASFFLQSTPFGLTPHA